MPAKRGGLPRRAMLAWLVAGALVLLCGVLGYLQYRWIGEVSVAARERMRSSLEASLGRLSQDFHGEISSAVRALVPSGELVESREIEAEVAHRYGIWRKVGRHGQMFEAVAIAAPGEGGVTLRRLDPETGVFRAAEWPAAWTPLRARLESRMRPWEGREPGGPPAAEQMAAPVFEVPLLGGPRSMPFPVPGGGDPPGEGPGPSGDRGFFRPFMPPPGGVQWAIFELNLGYVREVMLPELLHRHLGTPGALEYDVEVVNRAHPATVIYRSGAGADQRVAQGADASVNLFAGQFLQLFRAAGPAAAAERGPDAGRGPGRDFGRWRMAVRHRAGSLEAVVAKTRWRNLAVTGGVLLLMVLSVAALIRSTRRAQRLAEMQMDFVAGVSHELRTPLTVIHTAAYNLRGALAHNPSQVEQYGTLIQQESGRLKTLVEQVMQFASAEAGRVLQKREPLPLEAVVEQAVASSEALTQAAHCTVETKIEPDLPPVSGDAVALQHVVQNLIGNAAKYGAGGGWIGVFAARAGEAVEIRVVDRGPGVPADEQPHVFDAFFRGRRAVDDQVHGAGLGLNLAKKIVRAHGGAIELRSEEGHGAEFIVRLPAASKQVES
jgi:signal transduction histidine kinase